MALANNHVHDKIVQEYIVKTKGERYSCLPANEAEKLYYKDVFLTDTFQNHGHVIPYFWMPKFVEAKTQVPEHLNYTPIK